MNLKGTKVLVTGGALRVGREICLALAAAGCDVAVHYNRSQRAAQTLAARIRRLGCRATALPGDLTVPADCRKLISSVRRELGGLDVLVNNAAIFDKKSLRAVSERDMRRIWEINLAAPLRLMKLFAARARHGKIVNLLDQRIVSNRYDAVPYLLSKKALAELTAMAALELAPGITVNAVAPGAVLAPARGRGRELAGLIPLRRRPTPADVAAAVLFLLRADAVTGQVIFVDGGQHLLGGVCDSAGKIFNNA